MIRIISWNLLRLVGATLDDVVHLVRHERPDLLMMQEVTRRLDDLPNRLGGRYERVLQPGRIHGLAYWTPHDLPVAHIVDLQPGAMYRRVSQLIDLGPFTVANVHLSHGQVLNRRQLRRVARHLPPRGAVLGDYNLVGPCLVPGFQDVGPREHTHHAADVLPLRLDRCLARGLICTHAQALHRRSSDHRPILVHLGTPEMRLSARSRPPAASPGTPPSPP